ncbi:MAG: hypothetical protein QW478_13200 [Candidatus Micrarchaeaceae archaeon]
MKFAEIIEPSEGFLNNSNSYFLVLGIFYLTIPNLSSQGVGRFDNGQLVDQNGNDVDAFVAVLTNNYPLSGTMPVWNGTSVVNESFSYPSYTITVVQKFWMLVPPGYTLKNFGYAIGFWLSPEEIEEMILSGTLLNFRQASPIPGNLQKSLDKVRIKL